MFAYLLWSRCPCENGAFFSAGNLWRSLQTTMALKEDPTPISSAQARSTGSGFRPQLPIKDAIELPRIYTFKSGRDSARLSSLGSELGRRGELLTWHHESRIISRLNYVCQHKRCWKCQVIYDIRLWHLRITQHGWPLMPSVDLSGGSLLSLSLLHRRQVWPESIAPLPSGTSPSPSLLYHITLP